MQRTPQEVWASLTSVEATAVQAALWRHAASGLLRRPETGTPRYDCPYDKHIVDRCMPPEVQASQLEGPLAESVLAVMAARTAEIDDHLLAAAACGVRQVVLLGAGLDTRAWRLGLPPDARVYEVDTGSCEELKAQLMGGMEPRCARAFVKADLERCEALGGALCAAGWLCSSPSVWVLEGLVGYLERSRGDALFAQLAALSAPGSGLVATAPPTPEWRDELAAKGVKLHHSTFESGSDTHARLERSGWQHCVLLGGSALAGKHGLPGCRLELLTASV